MTEPASAVRSARDPALAAMIAAGFALYLALSAIRHATYRSTGFDLALFEQVIGHYGRLEAPASAIKGLGSIYADHVSPILALLGPAYAAWPSTYCLLAAQSLAVAGSALPLFVFARRRLDRGPALLLTAGYLLSGGLQEGVWFDFHEVAFAPLLIGLCIVLADGGRWWWSLAAAVALLSVKEDMAFVVVAIGVWYALEGQRRLGLAAAALGLGWYLLATRVIAPDYGYAHGYALANAVAHPLTKGRTCAYLLGAWLGLSLGSRLIVLAMPLAAERFLSSNPGYWTLTNHYSLAIGIVLALAAADGTRLLAPRRRLPACALICGVGVALLPAFPLAHLLRPSFYSPVYRDPAAALARIPAGAGVAASNRLAPHLGGRPGLRVFGPGPTPAAYVVAARDGDPAGHFPFPSGRAFDDALRLARRDRPMLYDHDGIVVLGPTKRR